MDRSWRFERRTDLPLTFLQSHSRARDFFDFFEFIIHIEFLIWPGFQSLSLCHFESSGFVYGIGVSYAEASSWRAKVWKAFRSATLRLLPGGFHGDHRGGSSTGGFAIGVMSGVYRCFCHRVPHRIHILPCKIHIFHLCFASGNTCPEGFATDATTLQQPPRSAAKRQCEKSFTDALENHIVLMRRHRLSSHDFLEISWELWFYTFASLFYTFVLQVVLEALSCVLLPYQVRRTSLVVGRGLEMPNICCTFSVEFAWSIQDSWKMLKSACNFYDDMMYPDVSCIQSKHSSFAMLISVW